VHEARKSACSPAAWTFSRAEEFWARYVPLTPYGKDAKEDRFVESERVSIEGLYDETEEWLAFEARRAGDPASLDRISYHLKRLPRLPDSLRAAFGALDACSRDSRSGDDASPSGHPSEPVLELVEIFQVKKFLANYRALLELVDGEARAAFSLSFESRALAAELDKGGSDAESFFIADGYDPTLKGLRAAIAGFDARIAALRGAALERAARVDGLDFRGRDFLVVPREAARAALGDRSAYSVEPYDSAAYLVRPQPGEEELAVEEERALCLREERLAEKNVLARLSRLAVGESRRLQAAVAAIRRLDLARARAALAKEYRLTRPELSDSDGELELRGARFLPCSWDCERFGLAYSALDFRLEGRAAVLFGSNMGGKTVALETILFLQVLAQAGFHVPALGFRTHVYPRLHFVGELRGGAAYRGIGAARDGEFVGGRGSEEGEGGGLSGFGFEIRAFVEAWADANSGALVVFDEFARTTSSREAEAILSAAVEAFASLRGSLSLFSTHFIGVARLPRVSYLRMTGLDRAAASAAMAADEPVAQRIRRINSMMKYSVEADSGQARESDAIAIASLLGLDRGIATRAAHFHDHASDGHRAPEAKDALGEISRDRPAESTERKA